MPRPNPLTPEVRAAFLAELRGGALVVAAAGSVGVAVSTLYWCRKRDPAFDAEWRAAAEASFGFVWREREGRLERVATKRRVRFAATRRGLYLASLGRSCDTKDSARWAGVCRSTVYRNLKRDPGFASANEAALERGYARLERVAALERAGAEARMKRFLDRGIEPTGEPPIDFDRQMLLLRRYLQRERPRREAGRPPRAALSPIESIEALERKLGHLDLGEWGRSLSGP